MQSVEVNVNPEGEAIDVTPKYDIVLKERHTICLKKLYITLK